MKKIIISIVLFAMLALPASAFFYSDSLVSVWNSRPDLQKVFPGDPSKNAKLEVWAKKYGWKEVPELFNYYPDKVVVERIIDNKVEDRIKALENKIANLTAQVSNCQGVTQIIGSSAPSEQYASRQCYLVGLNGDVRCDLKSSDYKIYDANNGRVPVNFLVK